MTSFLAFRPFFVQFLSVIVFAALFTSLLYTNRVVPPAPRSATPQKGINLTQAWFDLQHLTFNPHPYNSHQNDEVRNWLLGRAEQILVHNDVKFAVDNSIDGSASGTADAPVVLFNDLASNITFSRTSSNLTVYFEGTNIIIYIRGSSDPSGAFWNTTTLGSSQNSASATIKGGVLVNAHYDSVSTGYGATDDGVGVITILQLLSHFTTPGNKPKKGIILLLNNGEEDFLNGAWAFLRNPISQFAHVFLNLEGAGAGGRATLFRSTDTEVTRHYKHSKYPFGTSISADGFNRGLIQSQTDYVIFNGELGLRGLDVAFMEPRSRYHTGKDSTKYTSIDSLWHMLSASLATVRSLTSDTSSTFDGSVKNGKVDPGHGSNPIYFDLFGRILVVFEHHTMFAWTVTELVVAPIILILLEVLLARLGKWYLFSRYHERPRMISYADGEMTNIDEGEKVSLYGWRGFFRYPIAFVISTAVVIALTFLITKFNPLIVYSSEWAVWSMMLSAWIALSWFLLRGANAIRPSALNRAYALLWMFSGAWVVLVASTVLENNFHVGGGYFMMFYYAAIFFALLLSYLELLFVPSKEKYVEYVTAAALAASEDESRPTTRPTTAGTKTQQSDAEQNGTEGDEDAGESTSLLRGDHATTFGRAYGTYRHPEEGNESEHIRIEDAPHMIPYEDEQDWSHWLPTWTWMIQFLLLSIVPIVVIGQIALLLTAALHQTLADGSSVLTVYQAIAVLAILVLTPSLPFIHRFNWPIPTFFFLVFAGTLIYNLTAFPFSPNAQLKVFFVQRVDLDSGLNTVYLTGLSPFVENIVSEIPSASGTPVSCVAGKKAERAGLVTCSWAGLAPTVGASAPKNWPKISPIPPEKSYPGWIKFNSTNLSNSTRLSTKYAAQLKLYGRNTRNCRLYFETPITYINITDASLDKRFPPVGDKGTKEIRLWSRTWDRAWEVAVGWGSQKGLDGRVACEWNDDSRTGAIPALEEIKRSLPNWATVTKGGDGLVEGFKRFLI